MPGEEREGGDGAALTREAEAGGLEVLGVSEILSPNTKYEKDLELGLVAHVCIPELRRQGRKIYCSRQPGIHESLGC